MIVNNKKHNKINKIENGIILPQSNYMFYHYFMQVEQKYFFLTLLISKII